MTNILLYFSLNRRGRRSSRDSRGSQSGDSEDDEDDDDRSDDDIRSDGTMTFRWQLMFFLLFLFGGESINLFKMASDT